MFIDENPRQDATVIAYVDGMAIYASENKAGLFYDLIPEENVEIGQQLLDASFTSVACLPSAQQEKINAKLFYI